MPDFAFVVSDGTAQRPSAAVRSHAVKSGLQRKSQTGDASGPKASQLTVRQKDSLKGRFKLSDMTSKPKKTTKAGAKEQSSKSKNVGFVRTKATMARDSVALSESVMLSAGYDSSSLPSAQLQLVKSPSQGSSDPFNTFPVPLTNDIEKLAKFCRLLYHLQWKVLTLQSFLASTYQCPSQLFKNNGGITLCRIPSSCTRHWVSQRRRGPCLFPAQSVSFTRGIGKKVWLSVESKRA